MEGARADGLEIFIEIQALYPDFLAADRSNGCPGINAAPAPGKNAFPVGLPQKNGLFSIVEMPWNGTFHQIFMLPWIKVVVGRIQETHIYI